MRFDGKHVSDKAALMLRLEIEDFLSYEADLIDQRKFDEWLSILADDLRYRMPLVRNLAAAQIEQEIFPSLSRSGGLMRTKKRLRPEWPKSRRACIGPKSLCRGRPTWLRTFVC